MEEISILKIWDTYKNIKKIIRHNPESPYVSFHHSVVTPGLGVFFLRRTRHDQDVEGALPPWGGFASSGTLAGVVFNQNTPGKRE